MENITKYTPTELLKLINDTKVEHDKIKQEIMDDTYLVDELEKRINEKLTVLAEVEKKYVTLIEELNRR